MKTFLEPERPTPPYSSDSKTSASPGLSTTWVLHKISPYVAIAKPDYWFQNVFMGVTDPRESDHAFSTISGKVTAALYIQAGSLTLSHRARSSISSPRPGCARWVSSTAKHFRV